MDAPAPSSNPKKVRPGSHPQASDILDRKDFVGCLYPTPTGGDELPGIVETVVRFVAA